MEKKLCPLGESGILATNGPTSFVVLCWPSNYFIHSSKGTLFIAFIVSFKTNRDFEWCETLGANLQINHNSSPFLLNSEDTFILIFIKLLVRM